LREERGLSEAQPFQEAKCPGCGCERLVRDGSTGEVACPECGTVVADAECVPGFTPKPGRGSFAVMAQLGSGKPGYFEVLRYGGERYLRMVGRDGVDRTESNIATEVATIADRFKLPKAVEEEASYLAKRLLRAMREKKRKMTAAEIAAVTVWTACKLHGLPVTMDEYVRALGWADGRRRGAKSLLKLINKAESIMPLPKVAPDPKRYIPKFAARLSASGASQRYISALEAYSRMLCDAVADAVSGKDPVCIAVTALCVADEVLGGVIGKEKMLKLTGAGFSSAAAEAMKRRRPPIPKQLWDIYMHTHGRRVTKAMARVLHANERR